MILDITLKEKTFILKVNKKLFENKSTPITVFQSECPLMVKYSRYGIFQISGDSLGFDGCFCNRTEDGEYYIYSADFPELLHNEVSRKILMTIYLISNYLVEDMFYYKEFASDNVWEDESLAFVIFDGGSLINGYSIGGKIYPWFKKKMLSLNENELDKLNEYARKEINRVHDYYYKKDITWGQVTIQNNSFYIQVNVNGRWLSWKLDDSLNRKDDYSSHNMDFRADQFLCFATLIAINTWLRNN